MKLILLFGFFLIFHSIHAQEEGITVKDGKVGIGIEAPASILHIDSKSDENRLILEFDNQPASNGGYAETVLREGGIDRWSLGMVSSGYHRGRFYIYDYVNNREVLTIDSAGYFGLGTIDPKRKLHISGQGHQMIQLESTDNLASQLRMKTNSGNRRIVAENSSGVQKSQISLEDNEIKILGETASTNPLNIKTDGSNNVGINEVTTFGTSSVGVIGIGEGTAPTTSPSDIVQLYVESDSSGSAELKVRDEAGNVTVISDSQVQDLSYDAGNREIEISSGNSATLPIFNNTNAGLVPSVSPDTTSFLRADGTWASPSQPTTYLEDALSSDLTMSSSSNWYNGPSVTLTAGTWLVTCNLSFHKVGIGQTSWYGRISTGSTHYSGGIIKSDSGSPQRTALSMTSIITVASSTTIYGQGRSSASSVLMRAKVNHSGIYDVSNIVAVKLN